MVVSLKLCGICPQGWSQFQQQSYTISCYKVIERNDPVNSFDAEDICSEYKSDLLNIESREELKFVQKIFSSNSLNSTNRSEIFRKKTLLGLRLSIKSEPVRYQWSNERPFMLGTYNMIKKLNSFKFPSCVSMSVLKENININNIGQILFDHDCSLKLFNVFICERDVMRNWTSFDQLNPDQIVPNVSTDTTHIDRVFLFNCQENDQYLPYSKVCDGKLDCQSRLDEEFCSQKQKEKFRNIKYNTLRNKMYSNQFIGLLDRTNFERQGECDELILRYYICLPAQWVGVNRNYKPFYDVSHNVLCIDETCSRTFKYVLCDVNIDMIDSREVNKFKQKCMERNTTRCRVDEKINGALKCIYLRGKSGYPLGRPSLSHLENCENFTCPDDMVKCPLSYCIQVHYVGDGLMDCTYGEDEYYLVQDPGWTYAMSIFIILNFIIFTLVATGQAAIYIAATTGNITLVESQSKRKQDVDVARQLCFIAMSNFLCWFPVSLIGLLSMTGSSVSLETYAWIVVFVLPLNSEVNPNIYTIPFVYKKWKIFKEEKKSKTFKMSNHSDAIRIGSNEDRYEIMLATSERVSGVQFSSCRGCKQTNNSSKLSLKNYLILNLLYIDFACTYNTVLV
ncbi:hypothetical protein Btru_045079 [Bulinus truncatus]|nr:hypothetical protein Btru_045079 [Bulinus truncatus]